jgi:hypothetical protein
MSTDNIITRAIKIHGAKKIYEAAYKHMCNDKQPLINLGLGANTLRDANEIMSIAFDKLSATERAADYWDACQSLNNA